VDEVLLFIQNRATSNKVLPKTCALFTSQQHRDVCLEEELGFHPSHALGEVFPTPIGIFHSPPPRMPELLLRNASLFQQCMMATIGLESEVLPVHILLSLRELVPPAGTGGGGLYNRHNNIGGAKDGGWKKCRSKSYSSLELDLHKAAASQSACHGHDWRFLPRKVTLCNSISAQHSPVEESGSNFCLLPLLTISDAVSRLCYSLRK
jgi:hypothetical protein